jgi:hypothetical protein
MMLPVHKVVGLSPEAEPSGKDSMRVACFSLPYLKWPNNGGSVP